MGNMGWVSKDSGSCGLKDTGFIHSIVLKAPIYWQSSLVDGQLNLRFWVKSHTLSPMARLGAA